MKLKLELYVEQVRRWPASGQHILAQYEKDVVVVYQAYGPSIGLFAASNQRFGGEFSFNRMSWIKPNFLWMMYRSGWGTKQGQEITLAVHLRRQAFELILRKAVHSSYIADLYGSQENWRTRLMESQVRLQWDPDHDPSGARQERRAIQLGLSGELLLAYAKEHITAIEDISDFVAQQRELAKAEGFPDLLTPREEVYEVQNPEIAARLGVEKT